MSIGHEEASFIMSLSIEKMYDFIRHYGHHYPVLYLLNRGSPVELSESDLGPAAESVLSVDNERVEDGESEQNIYRTLIGFQMQSDKDEKNLQAVADLVAKRYDPDAIGLLMPSLYVEYTGEDPTAGGSLEMEPDAVTALHVCYWLRGEEKARMTNAPFQTDGRHITREELDWGVEEEDARNFGLVTTSYPWSVETKNTQAKLLNPWRK